MFWNTKNCEYGNVTPLVPNQSALLIQTIRPAGHKYKAIFHRIDFILSWEDNPVPETL